jgi:phosphatidylserine decarboxylase
MVGLLRDNLIWHESLSFFLLLLFIGIFSLYFCKILFYAITIALFLSIFFFRDPHRVSLLALHDKAVIVSPVDGKVVGVLYDWECYLDGYAQKIIVSRSLFDAYVMWMPCNGLVKKIIGISDNCNQASLFLLTEKEKEMCIKNSYCLKMRWWVKAGQHCFLGDKIGMPIFGSYVEIFLPKCAEVMVGIGQRIYGGKTVLARWA